jgi:hypothetical protein
MQADAPMTTMLSSRTQRPFARAQRSAGRMARVLAVVPRAAAANPYEEELKATAKYISTRGKVQPGVAYFFVGGLCTASTYSWLVGVLISIGCVRLWVCV